MNLRQVKIIYSKELKDILRDRRTLISMILVPILIFPLVTIGLGALMGTQMKKIERKKTPAAVIGAEHAPAMLRYLEETEQFDLLTLTDDSARAVEMLNDGAVKAVIIAPQGFELDFVTFFRGQLESSNLQIIVNESEVESEIAGRKLRDSLIEYRQGVVSAELKRLNLREDLDRPFWIVTQNIATEKEMGGYLFGMMMPYMIIILTLVGAMYPAIDLTAGEKERGTLETLLVSPVGRMEIVTGKYLTIMTASMATAILAMSSLVFTMTTGVSFAEWAGEDLKLGIDYISLLWVILMMLPLAAMFSALLMILAIFARSYREAQSYISPLMILAILPSMVTFIPGIEPNFKLALIPIVNVALMLKGALMGKFDTTLILITFISTAVYARVAMYISFKQFQREEVLFRV